MSNKMSPEEIEKYWTSQAREHNVSHAASWSDLRVIEMEISEIVKHLSPGDKVLDVGCANGFSTIKYTVQKSVSAIGVDYIPAMIENANLALSKLKKDVALDLQFAVGNILSLQFANEQFDKVVIIRVIINLGEWTNQKRGLTEALRVLKPGGILLLSEATEQGWRKLNKLRNEWGLQDIPMPSFNTYLDEDRIYKEFKDIVSGVTVVNFASTYYVGTRFFKPLIAQLTKQQDKLADPLTQLNEFFSQAPPIGDFGTQKLFIIRKRD